MNAIRNFFGNISRSIGNGIAFVRSLPGRLLAVDKILLLLIALAALLAVNLVLFPVLIPFATPFFAPGVACNQLGPPQGGNSRSMLALRGEDFQELGLKLELSRPQIGAEDELSLRVSFSNEDTGPIILFMPTNPDLVLGSDPGLGLRINIQDINNPNSSQVYGIPATAFQSAVQNGSFRPLDLHLLQAHDECHQSYQFALGLPPGEYRISASYGNTQAGVLQARPGEALDPLLRTQGVWASNVRLQSEELRFSILAAPTATPVPAPG
jgi:hypothetical protein